MLLVRARSLYWRPLHYGEAQRPQHRHRALAQRPLQYCWIPTSVKDKKGSRGDIARAAGNKGIQGLNDFTKPPEVDERGEGGHLVIAQPGRHKIEVCLNEGPGQVLGKCWN